MQQTILKSPVSARNRAVYQLRMRLRDFYFGGNEMGKLNRRTIPLCACGCLQHVTWNRKKKCWNQFLWGHNMCTDAPHQSKTEPQLCWCGCLQMTKPGNRFIYGHNRAWKKGALHPQYGQRGDLCPSSKRIGSLNPMFGRPPEKLLCMEGRGSCLRLLGTNIS